jgi:hypothetical protein
MGTTFGPLSEKMVTVLGLALIYNCRKPTTLR